MHIPKCEVKKWKAVKRSRPEGAEAETLRFSYQRRWHSSILHAPEPLTVSKATEDNRVRLLTSGTDVKPQRVLFMLILHSQVPRNAKNIVVRKQQSDNTEAASARAHRKNKLERKPLVL